jgi:hypothetical protein
MEKYAYVGSNTERILSNPMKKPAMLYIDPP